MIKTILLDMDCVLADFVEGLAQLWDITRSDLETFQPVGQYNYCIGLGKRRHCLDGQGDDPVTEAEFWKAIESRVGFWAKLPEFRWTRELLDLVRSITDDWYVVSSPSRCPRCIPEKREWLHRILDVEWYDRLIPTPHKELMAKPGVVLIDDHEVNCRKFNKEGGEAILFPAHHNQCHINKNDPMLLVGHVLSFLRSL